MLIKAGKDRSPKCLISPDSFDSEACPIEHKHVALLKKMCKAAESRGMTLQTFADLSVKFQWEIAYFLQEVKDVFGNDGHYEILDVGMNIEDVLDYIEAGCPELDQSIEWLRDDEEFEDHEYEVKRWLEKSNLDTEYVSPKDRRGQMGSDADSSKSEVIRIPPGLWDLGPAKNPYKTPRRFC
jgi:hypothetical protein